MTSVTQLTRYERIASWPLVAVAVIFLTVYAWPILDDSLSASTLRLFTLIEYVIWAIFVADYVIRFWLAHQKWEFFKNNLLDLTLIVLPMIRSLRALRILMLLRVLNTRASISFHGRVAWYVAISTALIIFTGALAVFDAEQDHPDANIISFSDAIWWAVVTMTTVGYGDHSPVSDNGRGIAMVLMLSGIALLGVVTATMASWTISKVEEIEESGQAATREDIHHLRDQIAELTAQVAALTAQHNADQPADRSHEPPHGTTPPEPPPPRR